MTDIEDIKALNAEKWQFEQRKQAIAHKYVEEAQDITSALLPVIEENKLLLAFGLGKVYRNYIFELFGVEEGELVDISEDLGKLFNTRSENIQKRIWFYDAMVKKGFTKDDELDLPEVFNCYVRPTLESIMREITPRKFVNDRELKIKAIKHKINESLKESTFVNYTATKEGNIVEKIDEPL